MRLFQANDGTVRFAIAAQGVAPNKSGETYSLWFRKKDGAAQLLGDVKDPVGEKGELTSAGPGNDDVDKFPQWFATYDTIVVTLDGKNAKEPGKVILSGDLPARRPGEPVSDADRRPEPDDRPHLDACRSCARARSCGSPTSSSRRAARASTSPAPRCVLGAPASLVGFIPGHTGRAAAALIAEEGVTLQGVPASGEIRSTAIVLEPDGRATVLNEPGPALGDGGWVALEARDRRRPRRSRRPRLLGVAAARARRRTATRCWSRARATRGGAAWSTPRARRSPRRWALSRRRRAEPRRGRGRAVRAGRRGGRRGAGRAAAGAGGRARARAARCRGGRGDRGGRRRGGRVGRRAGVARRAARAGGQPDRRGRRAARRRSRRRWSAASALVDAVREGVAAASAAVEHPIAGRFDPARMRELLRSLRARRTALGREAVECGAFVGVRHRSVL